MPPSDETVPFVRATDIKEGEIQTRGLLHVHRDQPPKMAKCLLREGEIIVVRSGVNTGDCAPVPAFLAGAYGAYDLILRLKDGNESVLPGFLTEYLDTSVGRAQLNVLKARSAQPHLNAEEIASIRVPLPTPSRQRELLAALDDARKARRQRLQEADELLGNIDGIVLDALGITLPPRDERRTYAVTLRDVFGSRCDALYYSPHFRQLAAILAASPLEKIPLGILSPDLAGGATPTRGDQDLYSETGVRFLRIMNVTPFEIRLDDIKYITEDVHNQMLGRSKLRANDILMTITGRVGTTAVVQSSVLPANINQHIVRIRLITDRVSPEYLEAYLNSSLGLAMTNRGVTGGTRIAIDYGTVRGLPIPVPDQKVQKLIAMEIGRLRETARRLRLDSAQLWRDAKSQFEEALLGPVFNSPKLKADVAEKGTQQ